jgi:hypothetical protein
MMMEEVEDRTIENLHDKWKNRTFEDDDTNGVLFVTAQEKRDDFFLDVTDKQIIQMCKLDEDNPISVMDRLMTLQGAGVIPPLPSFNHVIRAYDDNRQTICDEICRAVRRGRVK